MNSLTDLVADMQPMPGINVPATAAPLLHDGRADFSGYAGQESQAERTKSVLLNRVHPGGVDGITRHDSFNVAAGHFIRRYRDGLITRAQLDEEIRGWVVACMADPWPDLHIDKEIKALIAVDEKANGPFETPGGDDEIESANRATGPLSLFAPLPKATVFPMDGLGAILADAAAAIADQVQAPVSLAGVAILAAATVATQAIRDVELPTGEIKPLSGFFVSVAGSGERKSTVDRHALAAVLRYEDELRREYAPMQKLHIRLKKAWDAANNQILKPVGKEKLSPADIAAQLAALGPEPEPPLEPMKLCTEPTFEGLVKLMQIGQPAMGLFSDEGGQFIGGYGMSQDQKLKTSAALSSAWDGKAIKRVRAGDGAIGLHGRRLSMHLMVQPKVSEGFLSDEQLTDQGLLSRVCVTAPDSIAGTRLWRDPTPEAGEKIARYEGQLLEILRHPLPLTEGAKNELNPPKLRFSAAAKAIYVTFVNEVEAQLAPEGALRPIIGFASKLPEHASRLAAVLAVFEDPLVEELPRQAMERGIRLANFFASELMRLKMAGWLDPTVAKAERLRVWLCDSWKEDHISVRAVTQYAPPEFRRSTTANKHLVGILAAHHWLDPATGSVVVKGDLAPKAWLVVRERRS